MGGVSLRRPVAPEILVHGRSRHVSHHASQQPRSTQRCPIRSSLPQKATRVGEDRPLLPDTEESLVRGTAALHCTDRTLKLQGCNPHPQAYAAAQARPTLSALASVSSSLFLSPCRLGARASRRIPVPIWSTGNDSARRRSSFQLAGGPPCRTSLGRSSVITAGAAWIFLTA